MQSNSFSALAGLVLSLGLVGPAWSARVVTCGGTIGVTIQQGLAQLAPGGTLQIEPGVYHEGLTVPCDDVTIESTAPGVVLDGSVALQEEDLSAVDGRPGVFSWQLPSDANSKIPWIFDNGQPLAFTTTPLDPTKQTWSFYVDQNSRRLEVVFDGKGFPRGSTIDVPVIGTEVQSWDHKDVTIRGLEVYRAVGCGISCGMSGLAEDNVVMWTGSQGIVGRDHTVIRRNTIKDCNGPGVILYGNEMSVQDNLIVACGVSLSNYLGWYGSETKLNAQSYCTFEQNWLVDRPLGGVMKVNGHLATSNGKPVVNKWVLNTGFWPDVDCYHNDFVDNCIARLSHAGIYIEYDCNRNTIAENDVQDCAMGITLREASGNLVTRNWVWDHECLGWGKVDKEAFAGFGPGYDDNGAPITSPYIYDGPQKDAGAQRIVEAMGSSTWGQQMDDGLCIWHSYPEMTPPSRDNTVTQNLVQVSGVSVSVPLAQHDWPGDPERSALPRGSTLSNQLSSNYYTRPPGRSKFALLGKTLVDTFDAYRQLTSWDANGKVGQFTPAVIGLEPIWTIPSAAVNTTTPVSILHDPSLETFSSQSNAEPLFWHGSAVHPDYDSAPVTSYLRDPKLAHSGNSCISVSNLSSADATAQWWTSSSIPVKPGLVTALDFWVAADGMKCDTVGNGVRAKLQFTGATGHVVGEYTVIGDKAHPELSTGTYKYTHVAGRTAVPSGAAWMTVYLGADPSTGTVRFDDIHMGMVSPAPQGAVRE